MPKAKYRQKCHWICLGQKLLDMRWDFIEENWFSFARRYPLQMVSWLGVRICVPLLLSVGTQTCVFYLSQYLSSCMHQHYSVGKTLFAWSPPSPLTLKILWRLLPHGSPSLEGRAGRKTLIQDWVLSSSFTVQLWVSVSSHLLQEASLTRAEPGTGLWE